MGPSADRLAIICYPDPVLLKPAQPVAEVSDSVRQVARRMVELMHEAEGVGLAAPQVGLSWRLFVANPTGEAGADRVFINPELGEFSRESGVREEGCLSIPGVRADINRPLAATLNALDEEGQPVRLRSDDLAARVWQHEVDHLDGILIMDRMRPIDRMANRRALKDLERDFQRRS